jgi:hypothetical protein
MMPQNAHEQARYLIEAIRVEDISSEQLDWLNSHLEGCDSCTKYAAATESLIQALRSIQVDTDSTLVSRTQVRVRLRAHEMLEHEMRPLWISCAVSSAMTALSTSYLWQATEWLGRQVGGPNWLWQLWFLAFWFFPCVAAITVLVWQRSPLTYNADVG